MPLLHARFARCLPLIGAIAAIVLASSGAARAQVAIIVNGDPITVYDIEQRTKLMQIAGSKGAGRQQAIDELIADKLKLSAAKGYRLEITQTEIDNAFANIARNMRTTPEGFSKGLASSGINPDTLKARLKADLAWSQIIRGKYQSALQIGEKEVLTTLEARNTKDVGYEYVLTPILFVIARGAEGVTESRKRDAELLRVRFQDCKSGLPFARALRDVVVRDTIRRNSADLSPQLRDVLDKIEVGRLTPPEVTSGGVEVFALCEKKETTADTPARRALREEVYSEKFKQHADRYMKELKKGAMIEYRQQ
ncbi:MAG TPA: SurA N-terminal domain-containing protein [Pseudorhodoplanes sp.]|nr:SurA N-terminal domain-containing protein [Pseudorhodoplanes sp.]